MRGIYTIQQSWLVDMADSNIGKLFFIFFSSLLLLQNFYTCIEHFDNISLLIEISGEIKEGSPHIEKLSFPTSFVAFGLIL